MRQWAKPNKNQMVCMCVCVFVCRYVRIGERVRAESTLKRSDGNDNDCDGQMLNILLAF